jgi:hypothetical protein
MHMCAVHLAALDEPSAPPHAAAFKRRRPAPSPDAVGRACRPRLAGAADGGAAAPVSSGSFHDTWTPAAGLAPAGAFADAGGADLVHLQRRHEHLQCLQALQAAGRHAQLQAAWRSRLACAWAPPGGGGGGWAAAAAPQHPSAGFVPDAQLMQAAVALAARAAAGAPPPAWPADAGAGAGCLPAAAAPRHFAADVACTPPAWTPYPGAAPPCAVSPARPGQPFGHHAAAPAPLSLTPPPSLADSASGAPSGAPSGGTSSATLEVEGTEQDDFLAWLEGVFAGPDADDVEAAC